MPGINLQNNGHQESAGIRTVPRVIMVGPRPKLPFWTAERSGLVIVLILLFAAVGVIILVTGCQSGTTGLFRPLDPQVENSVTNAVAAALSVSSRALPFPWSSIFEAAGGTALTLLAAWQAVTHRTAIQNTKAIARLNGEKKT